MARIFVIEDDESLRDELIRLLEVQGHTGVTSVDFDSIVEVVMEDGPDCVILDLKLPGVGGHAICRGLRAQSDVPIIMLTSSDSEFDELMSMNLGADDYVTKPYNPAILLAHIQSVLRRTARPELVASITHRGVTLDVGKSRVEFEGRTVELTRNEFKILRLLMENRGGIISRPDLMNELWQSDAFIDDNTLTVNINRLRRSMERIGVVDYLITRRGQGYMV